MDSTATPYSVIKLVIATSYKYQFTFFRYNYSKYYLIFNGKTAFSDIYSLKIYERPEV